MDQIYSQHIYQKIRQDVANSYVRHELRKYLPSVNNWSEVDKDIEEWFDGSTELYPVRDYWNGVHGIMMGFKLYNQLLSFITAENVVWTLEEVETGKLTYTNFGDYTPKRVSKEPIIVTEKLVDGEKKLVVYDGNNRVNQAIKSGSDLIKAFVGRFVGEDMSPKNYWLPTSLLMEITDYAKKADKDKNGTYEMYVKILIHMLSFSESGRYEMRNRVLPNESEFKTKLLKDLGV